MVKTLKVWDLIREQIQKAIRGEKYNFNFLSPDKKKVNLDSLLAIEDKGPKVIGIAEKYFGRKIHLSEYSIKDTLFYYDTPSVIDGNIRLNAFYVRKKSWFSSLVKLLRENLEGKKLEDIIAGTILIGDSGVPQVNFIELDEKKDKEQLISLFYKNKNGRAFLRGRDLNKSDVKNKNFDDLFGLYIEFYEEKYEPINEEAQLSLANKINGDFRDTLVDLSPLEYFSNSINSDLSIGFQRAINVSHDFKTTIDIAVLNVDGNSKYDIEYINNLINHSKDNKVKVYDSNTKLNRNKKGKSNLGKDSYYILGNKEYNTLIVPMSMGNHDLLYLFRAHKEKLISDSESINKSRLEDDRLFEFAKNYVDISNLSYTNGSLESRPNWKNNVMATILDYDVLLDISEGTNKSLTDLLNQKGKSKKELKKYVDFIISKASYMVKSWNFDTPTTSSGRSEVNSILNEMLSNLKSHDYKKSSDKKLLAKNYVDNQKANGYKAIHFKIEDDYYGITEVQLRTNLQHYRNTKGSSSHKGYVDEKKDLSNILGKYETNYGEDVRVSLSRLTDDFLDSMVDLYFNYFFDNHNLKKLKNKKKQKGSQDNNENQFNFNEKNVSYKVILNQIIATTYLTELIKRTSKINLINYSNFTDLISNEIKFLYDNHMISSDFGIDKITNALSSQSYLEGTYKEYRNNSVSEIVEGLKNYARSKLSEKVL